MPNLDDARYKSELLSRLIKKRTDVDIREVIEDYRGRLRFSPLEELMISQAAWSHTEQIGVNPRLVFAHPDLLWEYPQTSQHYRGMALLSQKQVGQLAKPVARWEAGDLKRRPPRAACVAVSRLYNAVISSIIEGSADWALENGYRNIIATMGIRLDGMYRNRIGRLAEDFIKGRIFEWLDERTLIRNTSTAGVFRLPKRTIMRYGSEPDVEFTRGGRVIATIEIKGGKDPAGALERLGAMQKSFAETPAGCNNFLVAGVVTPEMKSRLDEIGTVKTYLLEDLSKSSESWDGFMMEIFHYSIRII